MSEDRKDYEVIVVPRQGVNDDEATLIRWNVDERQQVRKGDILAQMETTKTAFDIECTSNGFVALLAKEGQHLAIGSTIAYVFNSENALKETLPILTAARKPVVPHGSQVVSRKARELIESANLSMENFAGLAVVREEDVRKLLGTTAPERREYRGLLLDPDQDWDAVLKDPLLLQIRELLTRLRMRMRAKFGRHVSTAELLYDRWELAKDYGFGEGTSVYDSALILGNVRVGRKCWVGPNAILDGSGGLVIGDFVDVGSGAHIYSHNTIQRALTGHDARMFLNPTRIGNCCFIAPHAVVSAGTSIGDHSFVAAGSYVEGQFPAFSFLEGNPAQRAGHIVIDGAVARIVRTGHPRNVNAAQDKRPA